MRMRKKKHREDRIENCKEYQIENLEAFREDPCSVFPNPGPIHIEIGCGKGKFITQMGQKYPNINFVAIEKCPDVILMAMEKVKEAGLTNVKFIIGDAKILSDSMKDHSFERLYLNFSDPWKKSGQKKRRLTYRDFLAIYERILIPGGELHFKTDNRKLFEFSLNEFADCDLKMRNITFDLHNSRFEENVMTEYETLFAEQGMPIYRCEVIFRQNKEE